MTAENKTRQEDSNKIYFAIFEAAMKFYDFWKFGLILREFLKNLNPFATVSNFMGLIYKNPPK
jgi:hypothetical protein